MKLQDALFDLIKAARLSAKRNREASTIFGHKSGDAKDFEDVAFNLDYAANVAVDIAEREMNWQVE